MASLTTLFRLLGRVDDTVSRPLSILLIVGFCVYGIDRYLDLIDRSAALEPDAPVQVADGEPHRIRLMGVAQLFERLLSSGLMRLDKTTGLLLLPYEDAWLRCRAADPAMVSAAGREPFLSGKALLETLFQTAAGQEIRNTVRRWNNGRFFAAIRDNRAPGNATAQARENSIAIAPAGIRKENSWQAFGSHGLRLAGEAEVPESFGFVNRELLPGFGDWLSVSSVRYLPAANAGWPGCALPAKVDGEAVTFSSDTHYAGATEMDLQIIGRIKSFRMDGRDRTASLGELFESKCPRSVHAYPCSAQQAKALVSRSGRRLRIPGGQHRLVLVVEPIASGLHSIDGLPIQRLQAAPGGLALQWRSLPRAGQRGTYELLTADGVALSLKTNTGVATPAVQQLGLTPIVGMDSRHYGSLIGILDRSVPAHEHWRVRLSINAQMQAHAVAALQETIPALFPEPGPGQPERYAGVRRGVLLATDIDSGAILASASYPPVPGGVHRWDHYSFLRTQSFRSPLSVMAWQNMSRHSTPGSAFKLLTALALLKSADHERIADLLEGLDEKGVERVFGMPDRIRFPVRVPGENKARYVGKADMLSNKFAKPLQRTAIGEKGNCIVLDQQTRALDERRIGLAEALRDSLNHWFIHAVNEIDGAAATAYDAARFNARGNTRRYPPAPRFELVTTAQQLGLLDSYDLGAPIAALSQHLAGRAWRNTVLFADAGRLSLAEQPGGLPQYPMAWVLAQNAIGQGVQLSPLHMTRLLTAIASGRQRAPYLLRIERFSADGIAPAADRDTAPAQLGLGAGRLLLERGVKAAVETGTAHAAFADAGILPCRVYGKTGTAQLEKRAGQSGREPFNSAWFVGYALPDRQDAPRIAFSCLVTHAPQGKNDTGGKVCAPIVANFLSRLYGQQ